MSMGSREREKGDMRMIFKRKIIMRTQRLDG